MSTQPLSIPVRHEEMTLSFKLGYFSPEEIELRCTAEQVADAGRERITLFVVNKMNIYTFVY